MDTDRIRPTWHAFDLIATLSWSVIVVVTCAPLFGWPFCLAAIISGILIGTVVCS